MRFGILTILHKPVGKRRVSPIYGVLFPVKLLRLRMPHRVAFRYDEFAVTSGNPATYESSSGVVQTFCGRCGASLTLADERFPDEVYVSLASFADPEVLPPEFHIWRSDRLSWLETSDNLPRYVQFRGDGITEEQ